MLRIIKRVGNGLVNTEALGKAAYIGRARVVPLRNMGVATDLVVGSGE